MATLDPRIKLVDIAKGYARLTLRDSPWEQRILSMPSYYISEKWVDEVIVWNKDGSKTVIPEARGWAFGGYKRELWPSRTDAANAALENLLYAERWCERNCERG